MRELAYQVMVILAISYLVPKILGPYYQRPDRRARLMAKRRLPVGIFFYEIISMMVFSFIMGFIFFEFVFFTHYILNDTAPSGLSIFLGFVGAVSVGLPFGLICSNLLAWFITPIRKVEEKIYEGVPGGSFREANLGLLKLAKFSVPIAIICALVAIFYH